MPDIVKAKKFKDDVFLVSYNNPDMNVAVDFLSIKFPRNERVAIGGGLSPNQVSLGYGREKTDNNYETFAITSANILPLNTFKQIAAQSLSTASGAMVSPADIGVSFAYELRTCSNCNASMPHALGSPEPMFCSSCGKSISHIRQIDKK